MNLALIGDAGSIHVHPTSTLVAPCHRQRILARLAVRFDGAEVLPDRGLDFKSRLAMIRGA